VAGSARLKSVDFISQVAGGHLFYIIICITMLGLP
jgi:hypothetical protein